MAKKLSELYSIRDPLNDLGVGTGLFETDELGDLIPKGEGKIYTEITMGTGHFDFTENGDIKMKSDGDYSVGSTLPLHNQFDEGKSLQIHQGSVKWRTNDVATETKNGLLSYFDKIKLNSINLDDLNSNSVKVTLFHNTDLKSTTNESYETLYTGNLIYNKNWYNNEKLLILIKRFGTGTIKISIFDGVNTIFSESDSFTDEDTEIFNLSITTLSDSRPWVITIEGKGSNCNISRIKILTDPLNELSPILVSSGIGNSTNSTSFVELANSSFLVGWLDVDNNGKIIAVINADIETATSAELKLIIGTESEIITITDDSIHYIVCNIPSTINSILTYKIEGRIASGSGTLELKHYQIHVEK
ncbi:MAG: hypothetical protein PHT94_01085 [Candidatus Nanoarchaeia archaeon]|nr:hypothetical protein [Candidatus Nanoarchaeia archaeon]